MHKDEEAILAPKEAPLRLICDLLVLSLYCKYRFRFGSGQNFSGAIFGFNIHKRLLSVFEGRGEGREKISYDLNFGGSWFTSLCFGYFNTIFYSCCFSSLFVLVFVPAYRR
jgi:hypothetical protein